MGWNINRGNWNLLFFVIAAWMMGGIILRVILAAKKQQQRPGFFTVASFEGMLLAGFFLVPFMDWLAPYDEGLRRAWGNAFWQILGLPVGQPGLVVIGLLSLLLYLFVVSKAYKSMALDRQREAEPQGESPRDPEVVASGPPADAEDWSPVN